LNPTIIAIAAPPTIPQSPCVSFKCVSGFIDRTSRMWTSGLAPALLALLDPCHSSHAIRHRT